MNYKKLFSSVILTFVFVVLVVSFQNFSSTTTNYPKYKVVDASLGDTSNLQFSYAYAPSMIVDRNYKTIHTFFCSTGIKNLGFENWDAIRYTRSTDNGRTWSKPELLVRASNGVSERAACDPSVFYFNGYYYMYYSGNERDTQTVVFVARSKNINGPYLKYTNRNTWEANPSDPKVLIRPRKPALDGAGVYGAGQTTVVVKDGKIYLWHKDDSESRQDRIYFQVTTDPLKLTQGQATNVFTPDLSAGSVDVKYDPIQKRFVMFSIRLGHYKTSQIIARYSTDGLNWSGQNVFCNENCTPDFISNIGALGTEAGYLLPGNFLAYGAPYDLRQDCATTNTGHDVDRKCWGYWDIFGAYYSDFDRPGGEIIGYIDSLTNTATGFQVKGWACSYGAEQSIDVHIYARNPNTGENTFVASGKANRSSEKAVSDRCGTQKTSHRFLVNIDKSRLKGNENRAIMVYGISPYGQNNSSITRSGNLFLPSGEIKGYIDAVSRLADGSVRVRGWACAHGLENIVDIHIYVKDPATNQSIYVHTGKAGVASGTAVQEQCQNFTNKNRYDVTIPASKVSKYRGKYINVYGISPIGLINRTLSNSGKFKVP